MWLDGGRFTFDPFDPRLIDDPSAAYAWLLQHEPIHDIPGIGILVSRHRDVASLFRDRRLQKPPPDTGPEGLRPFKQHRRCGMVDANPPDHDRLRNAFAGSFSGAAVAKLQEPAERIVDSVLDQLAACDKIELVTEFAAEVSVRAICDVMGIDSQYWPHVRSWSVDLMHGYERTGDPAAQWRADQAIMACYPLLQFLLTQRQAGSDEHGLMSALSHELTRGECSEAELVHNLAFLMTAGHETTTRLICNGVHALLQHPEQKRRLVESPQLISSAVEEFLRFDPPLHLVGRWAAEDLWVDDHKVTAGTNVVLLLAAANRDPAVIDEPQRFDISRKPNPQLAFGAGVHNCLGSSLARMETRIAVGRLFQRFPNLYLAGSPLRDPSLLFRGFRHLPVALR